MDGLVHDLGFVRVADLVHEFGLDGDLKLGDAARDAIDDFGLHDLLPVGRAVACGAELVDDAVLDEWGLNEGGGDVGLWPGLLQT